MKRVAIYLISDGMGGAEQVVWQTVFGLSKFDSVYLIVNNEIASFYANLLPESRFLNIGDIFLQSKIKFRILRLLISNRFYSFLPFIIRNKSRQIAEYLKDNEISIIHSHLDYALYSSLNLKKILRRIKIFYSVHNVFGLIVNKQLKPLLPFSRLDFNLVDKMIFVSHYVYNRYKENNIPIKEFRIIYNGIDYVKNGLYIRPVKTNKEFEILYVGGSKYVKGFDILVETIDLLHKSNFKNSFHVVVLGPLSEHSDLVSLIYQRRLENIFRLIGFIDPPLHLKYFKLADILYMPSRSEALPIAAIEAVSLDLPVVASNVGGFPEIIMHGENGLLCNNNPQEYCDVIQNLIADYDIFLERTRNHNLKIKSRFESKTMCQELLNIY